MSCRYPQGIGSIRTLCRGVWHRTHGESLLCFPSLPSFRRPAQLVRLCGRRQWGVAPPGQTRRGACAS